MHLDLGAKVIRPSSLSTFPDCQRRFAAHHLTAMVLAAGYVLVPAERRHVGAAVGTGVHAGAAYTLEQKRDTGELGNASEAEDRSVAALKVELEFGTQWDETTHSPAVAERQVQRMVRSYRRHLAPQLNPVMVEQRLTIDVGDGWTISGQMDSVMAGDPNEELHDLKSGVRRRSHALQYGCYGVILHSHNHPVRKLIEDYLARVRIDKEQPPPVAYEVGITSAAQEAWEVIENIKQAAGEFERRAADPSARPPHLAFRANPSSSLCSQKFCRAWGTDFCKVHSK